MQICFDLSTAAQRAIDTILVAQVKMQGAKFCAQFCMVNLLNMVPGLAEEGFYCKHMRLRICNPVSILRKSISGRHRPVRVADGPMTARYRFT